MRTTVDLLDETFRQVKSEAARRGLKLKKLFAELIESGLYVRSLQMPRSRSPLPVIRPATGISHSALTNAQVQAIFDGEDSHVRP